MPYPFIFLMKSKNTLFLILKRKKIIMPEQNTLKTFFCVWFYFCLCGFLQVCFKLNFSRQSSSMDNFWLSWFCGKERKTGYLVRLMFLFKWKENSKETELADKKITLENCQRSVWKINRMHFRTMTSIFPNMKI